MTWTTYGAASKARYATGHSGYCWEITVSGVGGIKDENQSVIANKHYYGGGFLALSSGLDTFTVTHTNTGATGNISHDVTINTDWTPFGTTLKTGSGTTLTTQIQPANPCTFYFDDYWFIPLDEISISGIPASKINSLTANYDGELRKAIHVDGGDTLTFVAADCHFTSEDGSIGARFNFPWAYDQWEQNFYLFDMDGVLSCYYDCSDHKFKLTFSEFYNWEDIGRIWENITENWEDLTGTSTISLESSEQTFSAGWHDVAIGWDADDVIAMCVDGGTVLSVSGTWMPQKHPTFLYVGSDHNGNYQIDGAVDDVFDHDIKLSDSLLQTVGDARRKYLPVNSFLIDEQNATLVRKNVGATT